MLQERDMHLSEWCHSLHVIMTGQGEGCDLLPPLKYIAENPAGLCKLPFQNKTVLRITDDTMGYFFVGASSVFDTGSFLAQKNAISTPQHISLCVRHLRQLRTVWLSVLVSTSTRIWCLSSLQCLWEDVRLIKLVRRLYLVLELVYLLVS